jgi:hypothetical protein
VLLAPLAAAFALTSPAFGPGAPIPVKYTCDGANRSPPLRWTAPPRGTRSLALRADDPDAPVAGGFTHWLRWNVAPSARRLPAGARSSAEGQTTAGGIGYTGPCPPSGTHHYVFKLYALNARPALRRGATGAQFAAAIRGHVLATARLVGTYRR